MSKKNKESYFWTSYSDLMTSLFFIMLVLFVLIIVVLHNYSKKSMIEITNIKDSLEIMVKGYQADKEMINKIDEINNQFKELQNSGTFEYLPKSQKYIAKNLVGEIFEPTKSIILPNYKDSCLIVGKEIEKLLSKLSQYKEFKYQLVIEGNCANKYDKSLPKDDAMGYELSYQRALALYNLWKDNKIDLRKYNTEILICGSGFNGEDRNQKEDYNKRFVIQIIPKIKPPNKENNTKTSVDNSNIITKKAKVISNPNVENQLGSNIMISKVVIADSYTAVDFIYSNRNDNYCYAWATINPNTFIEYNSTKMQIIKAVGIEISPDTTWFTKPTVTSFTLFFPKIDKNTKSIDLIEPGESDWKFYGIKLE